MRVCVIFFSSDLLKSQQQLDQYKAKLDKLKSANNYNQWSLDQLNELRPDDSVLKGQGIYFAG